MELSAEDDYLVMASDGLWDVLKNKVSKYNIWCMVYIVYCGALCGNKRQIMLYFVSLSN